MYVGGNAMQPQMVQQPLMMQQQPMMMQQQPMMMQQQQQPMMMQQQQPPMMMQQQPMMQQQQPMMQQQQPITQQQQQPMMQQQPAMQQQQPRPAPPAAVPGGAPIVLAAGEQWMVMPVVPAGMVVPPGLEFLLGITGAHVRQKTDIVEVLTNIDTPNKYAIYNEAGAFMYYAKEQQTLGDAMIAQALGDNRGFYFIVTDGMGRPAFSVSRSTKLWTDCEMVVEAPPGTPCGFVSYRSECCSRGGLFLFDAARQPTMQVPFPSECDCGGDRAYVVISAGAPVGAITRKYPGFMKAAFTNCDNFAINFPADLDVRSKCTLLACAIMIDFIDYEDKRDNRTANRYNNGL